MEIEDLQDQIESQTSTIEAQRVEIERLGVVAKAPAPATPEGYTLEQVEALKAKAATADDAVSRADKLQGTADQDALSKEFPAITDWTAIRGDTLEDRRTHAEQINKMVGVAPGTPAVVPVDGEDPVIVPGTPVSANPGDAFGKIPPAGAPSVDKLTAEETHKDQEELKAHQKSNNLSGVLDSIFKLNPGAAKKMFSS